MKRAFSIVLLCTLGISNALTYTLATLRGDCHEDGIYYGTDSDGHVGGAAGGIFHTTALSMADLNRNRFYRNGGYRSNETRQVAWHARNAKDVPEASGIQAPIGIYEQFPPWITNRGVLVWQGWDGHDYEIFFYDGSTVTQLTNDFHDDVAPRIDERGHVVWRHFDGKDYEIFFFYDGGMTRQITNTSYGEAGLRLNDGGPMVWSAGPDGEDREILVFDRSNITQLTDHDTGDDSPKLNPNADVGYAWGEISFYDGSNVPHARDDMEPGCDTFPDPKANRHIARGNDGRASSKTALYEPSTLVTGQFFDVSFHAGAPLLLAGSGRIGWKGDGVPTGITEPVLVASIEEILPNRLEGLPAVTTGKISGRFFGDVGGTKSLVDPREPNRNTVVSKKGETDDKTARTIAEETSKEKDNAANNKSKGDTVDWDTVSKIVTSILKHSRKHNVDPALVLAIIKAESDFDHASVSPKGAIGLMQLMPDTADQMGIDPFDIEENIKGGIKHLSFLLTTFDSIELALAAYNAGSVNVKKYKGIPPFRETKRYVKKVLAYYKGEL
jgi:hypothetical protein